MTVARTIASFNELPEGGVLELPRTIWWRT
jgi:hypothetical protein